MENLFKKLRSINFLSSLRIDSNGSHPSRFFFSFFEQIIECFHTLFIKFSLETDRKNLHLKTREI